MNRTTKGYALLNLSLRSEEKLNAGCILQKGKDIAPLLGSSVKQCPMLWRDSRALPFPRLYGQERKLKTRDGGGGTRSTSQSTSQHMHGKCPKKTK